MPTISQLEYIVAIYRTGHFGRAASLCFVSQATLSAQVAKMEQDLGVVIFDRRAKPIVATEPGERIVRLAQEVVSAHARLVAAAKGIHPLTGQVTLGVIPTLASTVIPWFLPAFAAAYPEAELTVVERTTGEILAELQAMRLDAGLMVTPVADPGLEKRVVFYDPFYGYAHASSELLRLDEIEVDDIARDDLWLLEDGHCFRNQVVHLCGGHLRRILGSVRFEAGNFETLRGLVDRVGGCTLFPESYASTLPSDVRQRQIRSFRGSVPTREVSVVGQRQHWKSDLLDALASCLRHHAPRYLPRELDSAEVVPTLV
ncbi:MAG: hydrogen peroxide-inducible genes activator [Polyangiaceae bacterium]|jgi:LysR family hydrogen peroxide-inducible transcriptional activator|nr:hydrogen peroxide-inducible genes activator [Polyangiaceae bacterium]